MLTQQDFQQLAHLIDEKLAPVHEKLDDHGRTLNQHTKILGQHTKILDQHSKSLRRLKKDQGLILDTLDREQMGQRRLIERIETHVGLRHVSPWEL